MPYIVQSARKPARYHPQNPGELNYAITTLVNQYLRDTAMSPPNYNNWNEVIGVLECAKLELYRRHVAPYEDKKIVENGDVY